MFYNQYGMGYEDYLDYAEQEMVHVIGNLSNFDEEKFLQEHAVEITEQIDKEHGKGIEGHESAGEEPVHGAGGEVLSGEGVDESAGGGPLAGHGEGEAEVRGGHHKDAALEEEASGGEIAETRRKRRGGFKGERKTQEEIFAEEQKKPYDGDYKDILASSKTWQEAYGRLYEKAKEYRAKADEWRNKVYKKNGGSVEVGGKHNDLDANNVSIDYINERRRENAVKSLEHDAEVLEKGAEQLKERCQKGVEPSKDPMQGIRDAADAYREEKGLREQKATGAVSASHNERVLRDAVDERLREGGLDVFGDTEEGQRVLDMENDGDVRLMSFGEPYDYEQYPLGRVEPGLANKVVKVVTADANHGFANYGAAKAWAKENIAKTYGNEETGGKGDVRISNGAVDKFLSQSAVDKSDSKDVHMAVLKALSEVLKTSVDVETHPDFLKGENGKRSSENGINKDVLVHRLYGAVSIGGKPYRVKM